MSSSTRRHVEHIFCNPWCILNRTIKGNRCQYDTNCSHACLWILLPLSNLFSRLLHFQGVLFFLIFLFLSSIIFTMESLFGRWLHGNTLTFSVESNCPQVHEGLEFFYSIFTFGVCFSTLNCNTLNFLIHRICDWLFFLCILCWGLILLPKKTSKI